MQQPNIIFITIDSLRADHLGSFGYERPTSPFLDAFAKKSFNFKKHFATAPQTPGSFFSMFTGNHPLVRTDWTKTEEHPFLSEELQKAGYYTTVVQSNPYLSRFFDYDRGFNEFIFLGQEKEVDMSKKMAQKYLSEGMLNKLKGFVKKTAVGRLINKVRFRFMSDHSYATAEELNGRVIQFVESAHEYLNKPLFLWIHYMDVHSPYLPDGEHLDKVGVKISKGKMRRLNKELMRIVLKDPFKDEHLMKPKKLKELEKCYDAKIRYLDEEIEKLFQKFERLGINRENSVFAIASDHGESFGEHFGTGHSERLYDELVHVPFFMSAPGEGAQEVEALSSNRDFARTFLGVAQADENIFEGKNLLDVAEGKERHERIFAEIAPNKSGMLSDIDTSRALFAMRTDKWKVIIDRARDRKELYNLEDDPGEENNLAESLRGEFQKLSKELREHIEELGI